VFVKMISIILPIHNQQDIIEMILDGIANNSSKLVKEIFLILDGCTDNTEDIVSRWIYPPGRRFDCVTQVLHAANVFETKADNLGLRMSTQPYAIIVQDDMLIQELGWDARLIKPMLVWDDVFAVTARSAHNHEIAPNGDLAHANITGAEWGQPRDRFVIRQSANRGPLALRMDAVRELGYLDEWYAPYHWDEHDICMRAYDKMKLVSGAYPIRYRSDPIWGTTRKSSDNAGFSQVVYSANVQKFINRHREAIGGPKHDETRMLD
jgi:glycosyltransferase involved in cell wall biosynthesis